MIFFYDYDYISAYPSETVCKVYLAIAYIELGLRWLHDRVKDSKVKPWQRDPSGRWCDPKTAFPVSCDNSACPICTRVFGVPLKFPDETPH